jgi:hypothetical protein
VPDLRGDVFAPALSGQTFAARWKGQPIGELFTILKATMPQGLPRSLPDDEYAAIVAYLLSMNGYPDGQRELTSDVPTLNGLYFRD